MGRHYANKKVKKELSKYLICNECFNLSRLNISTEIKLYHELNTVEMNPARHKIKVDIEPDFDIYNIECFCENCNKRTSQMIADEKLGPAISMLKFMGLDVEAHSEGSYKLDTDGNVIDITPPYILFKKALPERIKHIKLPLDWNMNKTMYPIESTTIFSDELIEFAKGRSVKPHEADRFFDSARYSLIRWIEKL